MLQYEVIQYLDPQLLEGEIVHLGLRNGSSIEQMTQNVEWHLWNISSPVKIHMQNISYKELSFINNILINILEKFYC